MKIYSPSQTKAYLESPLGWSLHYRDGWSPKILGRKELSGFLGQAFAKGIEWYHGLKLHEAPTVDVIYQATEVGTNHLQVSLTQALDAGHIISPKEDILLTNLPDHLEKALTKAITHSPIPGDWKVLEVEAAVPEAGRCRLDLIVETPQGVSFIDYKTKVSLEGYQKDRTITEWSQDWQFYHYAWALRTFGSAQVPSGTAIPSYHVALITVAGSTKPSLHTFPLDEELQNIWYACAQEVWSRMERIEEGSAIPIWSFNMTNRYGPDPWADAVVNARLHPHLMAKSYVRKERLTI